MSRTRITIEGSGELLHEGPTAPDAWERLCAAERAERDSHCHPVMTGWGPGWYDDRRPHHVHVENTYTRPLA